MNRATYLKMVRILQDAEYELTEKKNKSYAASGNVNQNFDDCGMDLEMRPAEVLWVYLHKHLCDIKKFCKTGCEPSEPILSRIMDARNYLGLLAGMVLEDTPENEHPIMIRKAKGDLGHGGKATKPSA